ncbi:MAG: hypothetical protein GY948_07005 [Alphaproteobacteria bacterium]|nr:hypothetical protein [Alphaproteobacteria bacterium]
MIFKNGLQIVQKAIIDILQNFPAALRITLPWCVPLVLLALFVELRAGFGWGIGGIGNAVSFALAIAFIGYFALAFPAFAISWHRFILRDQAAGRPVVLDWNWPLMSYLVRSIGISFIIVLALMPLFIFLMVFSPSSLTDVPRAGAMLPVYFVASAGLYYVTLRLSMLLPAIALEERNNTLEQNQSPHTFKWAWQATKPRASSILVVAVILTTFSFLVEGVTGFLVEDRYTPGGGMVAYVGYAIYAAVNWCWFMLNLSVLTTLYGYTCLNKPLSPEESSAQATKGS